MNKQVIFSQNAPKPVGAYSQAIRAADWIFVSGQIPINPQTGELLSGDIQEQTRLALDNIKAVLEAAGCGLEDVVKTTIYMTDLGLFAKVNEVYSSYFPEKPPARACVAVAGLPKGAGIEIEAIAIRGKDSD